MNRPLVFFAASLACFALALPAHADRGENRGQHRGHGEGVQRRLENQRKRIEHGVKKGRLTEEQASALKQNLDKIEADKNAALQDGKLSKDERQQLKGDLQKSSQEIRALKHPDATPSPVSTPAPSPGQ